MMYGAVKARPRQHKDARSNRLIKIVPSRVRRARESAWLIGLGNVRTPQARIVLIGQADNSRCPFNNREIIAISMG